MKTEILFVIAIAVSLQAAPTPTQMGAFTVSQFLVDKRQNNNCDSKKSVKMHDQCGGMTGGCGTDSVWALCPVGSSCQRKQKWYWQCLPSAGRSSPSPSSKTNQAKSSSQSDPSAQRVPAQPAQPVPAQQSARNVPAQRSAQSAQRVPARELTRNAQSVPAQQTAQNAQQPAQFSQPAPTQQQQTPGGGDIKYYDIENCATRCPSQHIVEPKSTQVNEQRFGFTLNKDKLNPIFTKLFGQGIVDKALVQLRKVNGFNYNANNPDPYAKERQLAGTYLALSVAAKFKLLPPSSFSSEKEASARYGQLKVAGLKNDLTTVKKLVPDMKGLTVEQVAYLFGTNEHQNLHAIVFGNLAIRNALHATSLNDKVGVEVGDSQDQTPPNTLGGYNDKGTHPQWGWFDAAKGYNALVVPGN